jgi:AraC-like DNA-binding protein
MVIHIKNMVCGRCINAVWKAIEDAGLHAEKVSLGEVVLLEDHQQKDGLQRFDQLLRQAGFERIDDRRSRLIEALKNKIIQIIHYEERLDRKLNWSVILSDALHYEYSSLSVLFSSVEGITLEQYIIRQKIEKVKELLFYDELTLSEIAYRLGYSSVAHLSGQFKKITGFTPSALRKTMTAEFNRKSLDKLI